MNQEHTKGVLGDSSFERGSAACPVSSWQIWKVLSGLMSYKMRTNDSATKSPLTEDCFFVMMNVVRVFSSTCGWINILTHLVFSSAGSFECARKNSLLQLIPSNLRGAEEERLPLPSYMTLRYANWEKHWVAWDCKSLYCKSRWCVWSHLASLSLRPPPLLLVSPGASAPLVNSPVHD